MLEFNNPLRAYRDDRRLSLKDLADVINVSRSVMAAIEDGRRTITREQCDALAKRLMIDPGKLAYLVRPDVA